MSKNIEKMTPSEYSKWLNDAVAAGERGEAELKMVHVRQQEVIEQTIHGGRLYGEPSVQVYSVRAWGLTPEVGVQGYLKGIGAMYEVLYAPGMEEAAKKSAKKGKGAIEADAVAVVEEN